MTKETKVQKVEITLELKEMLVEIKEEGHKGYMASDIGVDYECGYETMRDRLSYYIKLIDDGKLKISGKTKNGNK